MTTSVLDFPALEGRVVTEGHTAICAERGHAKHKVDGTDSGVCPRCGDVLTVPEVTVADVADMLEYQLYATTLPVMENENELYAGAVLYYGPDFGGFAPTDVLPPF